jgi:hypothetical protein
MLRSSTVKEIELFLQQVKKDVEPIRIRQYLYCMQVAGWIQEKNLGKNYYIPYFDRDPINYSFSNPSQQNLTRADKVKTEIGEIITREHLRSKKVLSTIGAGDEPVTLDAD